MSSGLAHGEYSNEKEHSGTNTRGSSEGEGCVCWAHGRSRLSGVGRGRPRGNDEGAFLSSDAIMQAGAVTASTDSGPAVWYNPAGLGISPHDSIDASVTGYTLRLTDGSRLVEGRGVQSKEVEVLDVSILPAAVSGMRHLGRGVSLGFGLFVPESRSTRRRARAEGSVGASDVVLSGSELSTVTSYFAGAALGFELWPGLRVGGGLLGMYELVDQWTSVALDLSAQGERTTLQLARADDGDVIGVMGTLGFRFDAQSWSLGASLRSPALLLRSTVREFSQETFGSTTGGADQSVELRQTSDGSFLQPVRPYLVRGGFAIDVSEVRLATGVSYQSSLQSDEFGLKRRAITNVRFGARGPVWKSLHLGGGFFTDAASRPISDTGTHVDFYGGVVALELQSRYRATPSDAPASESAPSLLVFSTTVGFRYGYGVGKAQSNRLVEDGSGFPILLQPRTHTVIHEVGIELGSAVRF